MGLKTGMTTKITESSLEQFSIELLERSGDHYTYYAFIFTNPEGTFQTDKPNHTSNCNCREFLGSSTIGSLQ
jgi:hypothetical protein